MLAHKLIITLLLVGVSDPAVAQDPPPEKPRRTKRGRLVLPPHRRRAVTEKSERRPAVTQGRAAKPANEEAPPVVDRPGAESPVQHARQLVKALQHCTSSAREELADILAELRALGVQAIPELRRGLDTRRTIALFALVDLLRTFDPEGYEFVHARALDGLTESSAQHMHVVLHDWKPERSAERLIAWLGSGSRGLRAVATAELGRAVTPEILASVRRLAEQGESGPSRAAALRFLIERDLPELEVLCARGLRDESALVGREAVEGYVEHATESTWTALLQTYREVGHDVTWGRVCVALVGLEDARHREIFSDEDFAAAISATTSPDLFVQTAGALVATVIGRRSERANVLDYLVRPLPHALVQAVGGMEGHPELPLARPAIYRVLADLTGEDLGERGDAWREWWVKSHLTFQPRRSVIPLVPPPTLRLRRVSPDGLTLDVTLVPWTGESVTASLGTYYLDAVSTGEVVDAVRELGLHRGRFTSGFVGDRGEAYRSLELIAGEQTKHVEVALATERRADEPSAVAALNQLLDELEGRAQGLVWQAFPDPDVYADGKAFLEATYPRFHALVDDAQRTRFLRSVLIAALDDLDAERRLQAFFVFRDTLAEGERLTRAEGDAVLTALADVSILGRGDRAFLDLVADHAKGIDIARLKTFFALRPISEEGTLALGGLLAARGKDEVVAALADERVPVLAAALEAVSTLGEDAPLEDVLFHATSRDWAVRIAAIRSLGRLEALGAAPLLVRRFAAATYAERLEIAEAAARIGGGASQVLIRQELEKEDRLMRRAIFQGLELSSSTEASVALATFAVARGRFSEDGRRARSAFLHKPRDVIRRVARALLTSSDPGFRRGVAILLAEAYDREALEPLVDAINADPTDRELMDAFERVTCQRVDLDRWPYMAADFLAAHRGEQPSRWFAQALDGVGVTVPEELHAESRVALSPPTIDLLIQALLAPGWSVRLHAVRYLEEHFETSFGDLAPETRLGDFRIVAEDVRELMRSRSDEGRR
ncbi:MAG: hypothetical protein H6834_18585 [Planctomycetes bacterium]|nr:hypothetical protein [Planctomycetota bacterium]